MVLMSGPHPLLASGAQWKLYLPVMAFSFVLMVPLVILAEARRKMKQVFLLAIAMLALAEAMMAVSGASLGSIAAALLVFFVGFNALEATLPSIISKIAPASAKGTAVGVYNTCEFLGAFAGGALGGMLYVPGERHQTLAFAAIGGLLLVWLVVASGMQPPRPVATRVLHVEVDAEGEESLRRRLLAVPGVAEVEVFPDEGVAYCKVDSKTVDEDALRQAIAA